MLVPLILIAIAVVSTGYVAYEILRGIVSLPAYLVTVAEYRSQLRWWLDARFSVIPAEQHAAVEVCADVYGLVPADSH